MSEAGSRGGLLGEEQHPSQALGASHGVGGGGHSVVLRGHCSHLGPQGGPDVPGVLASPDLLCGSLTWCLHVWGQLEQRIWGLKDGG